MGALSLCPSIYGMVTTAAQKDWVMLKDINIRMIMRGIMLLRITLGLMRVSMSPQSRALKRK